MTKTRSTIHCRYYFLALLLGIISVILTTTPASAELVLPSSRVVSSLNVRAAPTTSSSVITKIRPGDVAVLVGRSDKWYQVSMPSEAVGYVNQAWSVLEADLRLGTWNLKKLGHGSSKEYSTIAGIINDSFDILTVIEVMQKDHSHPGYDALLQALGPYWSGIVTSTPRPNTVAGDAEFYAILYRPTAVAPCSSTTQLEYFPDNEGGPQGTGVNRFVREPAFACFATVSESGTRGWDFILAAYHATWAGGNKDAIVAEASSLGEVFAAMRASRPGEADLFIAGDLNLTPDILAGAVSAADRTIGTGSTLNSNGGLTANLYDHLLVFDTHATSELAMEAKVLDVRNRVSSNKVFYKTVSDHLPIMARFFRNRADDD